MKTLLGSKVGMTQIFGDKGQAIPVTVIQAGPCVVTQLKNVELDGYTAVQLGFGEAKKLNKPDEGQRKAAGTNAKHLREVVVTAEEIQDMKVGDRFDVAIFAEGDKVKVVGTSKGKGFAGTIKRHNFHRGPKTHGSHNYRGPGSIGSMYPQHVFKGMKMSGRMGHSRTSVKNLEIVKIDTEHGLLLVKGAIPGPKKSLVMVEGA
jgi:large subunit ribosomal protein L3